MDIERKMCAVECDVVFKCEPQLPTQRTSYWLQPWPEQTVMDDQEIDVSFYRLGQNARRNVDRRADSCDPAGIFDLQTVQRIVPIAHFANPQVTVRITDNVGKRRHSSECSGVCDKRRGKTRANEEPLTLILSPQAGRGGLSFLSAVHCGNHHSPWIPRTSCAVLRMRTSHLPDCAALRLRPASPFPRAGIEVRVVTK